LLRVAGACKFRIDRGVFCPLIDLYCRVLRPG
jgi:hypothetical protein